MVQRVRQSDLTELEHLVCRAFARGERLDLRERCGGPARAGDRTVRAGVLVALLCGRYDVEPETVPALRLVDADIRGSLDLEAVDVPYLVELRQCSFDEPPQLQLARFAGLRLPGCTIPGLRGRNLRVDSTLELDYLVSTGTLDLADATVRGTLRLGDAEIRGEAEVRKGTHHCHAILASRLHVSGSLQAARTRTTGELRLQGAFVGGNLHLGNAQLSHAGGDALAAAGITVRGDLLCEPDPGPLTAEGRVVLAGAQIGGDVVFSGASLRVPARRNHHVLVLPRGVADGTAALVADRMRVEGNVELDDGVNVAGSVRLTNSDIGGYLRLSGARLGQPEPVSNLSGDRVPLALVADGLRIAGDLEARGTRPSDRSATDHEQDAWEPGAGAPLCAHGQVRLTDARIRGSASLSGARLVAPGFDALFADRLQVGGTLFLRNLRANGSVRLQNVHIGSTLDCTGAKLTDPRRRPDGTLKPSVDARVANIGKDLLCGYGFLAAGGVHVRLAEVGKMISFSGARLGSTDTGFVLNAYGLTAQRLILRFAAPPRGRVLLVRANIQSVGDDDKLWEATGGVALEDFRYESIDADPEVDTRVRLAWLRKVLPDFAPGPYEQLALTYRDGGHEERARKVLLEKQRRRYAELGPAGRLWGFLQRWTVGYGYRPWLAMAWLGVFWLFGALWFRYHPMEPLDDEQHPVWNAWLLSADTLLPIVTIGQDNMWQISGVSQWIHSSLTAVGWILASTAAAGATRVLKRD
ncbi:oxidoreductase [Longimycelium tulufanense]|uniref:Oxidoreductase n=1 Tax=Longimycelium tulufanense TaxID=907463 RepID=A0A8J3CAU3_9PSEU|nr:hypothetical protein [Longimycelium tulufanense]GGM66942.1 oxidoreductase [Longimycelium tulufanense]